MAPSQWGLLKGKSAAITGGTTGIGRAIALEYIRQGCNVAINHLGLERDVVHKDSLIKEALQLKDEAEKSGLTAGELFEVAGDVRLPETGKILVEKAVEKWGRLDVFVSNAGVCQFAEFLEYVTLPSQILNNTKTDIAIQTGPRPLRTNRPHQSRRRLLLLPSCRATNGKARQRWFHHRDLLHQCPGWRGAPNTLHTHQGWSSIAHAEHGCCIG